jgi:hypothetical protein
MKVGYEVNDYNNQQAMMKMRMDQSKVAAAQSMRLKRPAVFLFFGSYWLSLFSLSLTLTRFKNRNFQSNKNIFESLSI